MFAQIRRLAQVLAIALVLPALRGTAAAAAADTAWPGWTHVGTGMLNVSQAWHDNWAKGGTDALTWELGFQGSANLDRGWYSWENQGKIAYGRTKVGDKGSRKSADEWTVESVYTRKLGKWASPFLSSLVRSQFAPGYSYDDENNTRRQISDFFDPAYFFQTAGVKSVPFDWLTERLGFTIKETVSGEYGYANDPETLEEQDVRVEYGLSSITELKRALMENILLNSRFEVFANFQGVDQVDLRWENKIAAKVNKLISVNLELDLVYDKDQSMAAKMDPSMQTRESLSIGITFLTL